MHDIIAISRYITRHATIIFSHASDEIIYYFLDTPLFTPLRFFIAAKSVYVKVAVDRDICYARYTIYYEEAHTLRIYI